ncbi:MAG: hypothetical protein WDZ28_04115 [Simkaniaceae bacterium]
MGFQFIWEQSKKFIEIPNVICEWSLFLLPETLGKSLTFQEESRLLERGIALFSPYDFGREVCCMASDGYLAITLHINEKEEWVETALRVKDFFVHGCASIEAGIRVIHLGDHFGCFRVNREFFGAIGGLFDVIVNLNDLARALFGLYEGLTRETGNDPRLECVENMKILKNSIDAALAIAAIAVECLAVIFFIWAFPGLTPLILVLSSLVIAASLGSYFVDQEIEYWKNSKNYHQLKASL